MRFDNTWTGNWEGAFRGMRFAMKSGKKADSQMKADFVDRFFTVPPELQKTQPTGMAFITPNGEECYIAQYFDIGPNDMKLAKNLILASKGGKLKDEDGNLVKEDGNNAHRKFLRQIAVSVDISAPLYYWSEMDTYKVGTTANSESTMHKLNKDAVSLGIEDFVIDEGMEDYIKNRIKDLGGVATNPYYTDEVNRLRHLKQMLPTSYIQKRHWTANYEAVRTIYHQRKNHRLKEWNTDFVNWVKTLPYAEDLIMN